MTKSRTYRGVHCIVRRKKVYGVSSQKEWTSKHMRMKMKCPTHIQEEGWVWCGVLKNEQHCPARNPTVISAGPEYRRVGAIPPALPPKPSSYNRNHSAYVVERSQ